MNILGHSKTKYSHMHQHLEKIIVENVLKDQALETLFLDAKKFILQIPDCVEDFFSQT